MSQFYFKIDGRSKPYVIARTLPDSEDAKDWIQATIADDNDIDFSVNFDAYVYDADQKTLTPPGNTNTPTLDSLSNGLKSVSDSLQTVQTAVKAVPQVQQMMVQSTKAQAETNATQDEFKTMMVNMSKTLAQIQASLKAAPASTAPATDTSK